MGFHLEFLAIAEASGSCQTGSSHCQDLREYRAEMTLVGQKHIWKPTECTDIYARTVEWFQKPPKECEEPLGVVSISAKLRLQS